MSGTTPEPNMPPVGQSGTQQSAGPGQADYGQPGYQQGGYPQPGYQQGGYPPAGGPPPGWNGGYAPVTEAQTRITGRRVVQYIIDSILVSIIPALVWWLFPHRAGFEVLAAVITIAVYYLYWVQRPYSHAGQTFGMQLLQIRVISKHGGQATLAQLLIRAILLIVDALVYGLVGWITMLCSRYRQRIGDHAAGTLVIPANLPVSG